MIKIANQENFEDIIKKGKSLIQVSMASCVPCQKMKEGALSEIEDINVATFDALENSALVERITNDSEESIMSVPVLVLYEDGEFKKRHDGVMNLEKIKEFVG